MFQPGARVRAGKLKVGLGSAAAILALLAVVACAVAFCVRRKRAEKAQLRKQASAYSAWQDGTDGDEMQRSASGAADDGKLVSNPLRAASAHAYVTGSHAHDDPLPAS